MRGPENSKVTLTILRKGEKKPFEVTLTRAVIQSRKREIRDEGDIGYIRITSFSENTDAGLKKAVADLKKQIGPRSEAMSSICATIRAACSTRRSPSPTIS